MQVEAVLFDLFNTLVLVEDGDEFYLPSLKKLHRSLVKNGVKVPFEDFKRAYFQVRDRLYTDAEKNLQEPHFNVRISRTLQCFGYDFEYTDPVVAGATKAFCKEFMGYLRLDEDALYVLQELRSKCKIGLVSNFAIPECVGQMFEKFGLKGIFDTVVISASINKRKPSPDIFQKALVSLGVEASNAVFVGDTLSLDVRGVRNAGIKSVLIKRPTSGPTDSTPLIYEPPEQDQSLKPDKVIRSLKELLHVLEDC